MTDVGVLGYGCRVHFAAEHGALIVDVKQGYSHLG